MLPKLNSRRGTPATEARFNGSRDRLVGANGEVNAGSTEELLGRIVEIAHMVQSGSVDTRSEEMVNTAEKNRQILEAAYHSESREWSELGAAIGGQLKEAADREGFMRRVLSKQEVNQGSAPRIRVRTKNVTAIMAASPADNIATFVHDNYLMPEEWYVSSNIRVEEREINQNAGDILEDKYYEAQEAIMVTEDRKLKAMMDDTVGISNDLQIIAGSLTPTILSSMTTQVSRWGVPPQKLIFAIDILDDFRGNADFLAAMDEVSKFEVIQTGRLGSIYGMDIITDAFRHPMLKVLNQGELYVTSSPEMTGGYTDRGPVQSKEVNDYPNGSPSRGWFFFEQLSMALHNARAVCKGTKS